VSFQKVQHLVNPWNEDKPIKIGRDGQEIEPSKIFFAFLPASQDADNRITHVTTRPWKDHFKSDLRSDQDHLLKKDLRSDQDHI
jgi:hypothetical protein